MASRTVTRNGRSFNVVDDERTASWDFWGSRFAGDWESHTLDTISFYADPARDYVDVGAWVGPTVLWAAPLFSKCVAVEPDPAAIESLCANIAANRFSNVSVVTAAVSASEGVAPIETGGAWGDSMSSLVHRWGRETQPVRTLTLPSLWERVDIDAALIKIDIEGAEAAVIPAACDFLHDLGCPVLLSLHLGWLTAAQYALLMEAVRTFRVEYIDETDPALPTVVLR